MRRIRPMILVLLLFTGLAFGCDFQTERVAARRFYRSHGWTLPSLEHGRVSSPVAFGVPLRFGPGPVPGLTSRLVTLDAAAPDALIFEIPRQDFLEDGQRYVMSWQLMKVQEIWRYDFEGKIAAYTLGLTPVVAQRENGKWKVNAEAGCIFYGTLIDDNGDGIFRLLAPGWMKPELVPGWAHSPKRDPA